MIEKNAAKVLEGLLIGLIVEIDGDSYKYVKKGDIVYDDDDNTYFAIDNDLFVGYGDMFIGTHMGLGTFIEFVNNNITDDEYTIILMNIGLNSIKKPNTTPRLGVS